MSTCTRPRHRQHDAGFSLLESMFALLILMIVAVGVLPLGLVAVKTTENQGHLAARTTEYAQDKMEQLLVLAYGDPSSDTRAFPVVDTGGSGLTIGGSSNPDGPVALYVDYLDIDGNVLPSVGVAEPATWFYKRVWQIDAPAGTVNLKQITVTVTVKASAAGGLGLIPRSTLSALKTFPY
jgi:type II secretory pathway pseudopilin PulG